MRAGQAVFFFSTLGRRPVWLQHPCADCASGLSQSKTNGFLNCRKKTHPREEGLSRTRRDLPWPTRADVVCRSGSCRCSSSGFASSQASTSSGRTRAVEPQPLPTANSCSAGQPHKVGKGEWPASSVYCKPAAMAEPGRTHAVPIFVTWLDHAKPCGVRVDDGAVCHGQSRRNPSSSQSPVVGNTKPPSGGIDRRCGPATKVSFSPATLSRSASCRGECLRQRIKISASSAVKYVVGCLSP